GRGSSVRTASMARRNAAWDSRHSRSMRPFQALAQRRRQRPTGRGPRQTYWTISSLRRPVKARRMMEARCRRCEGAVTASRSVQRISCWRSVIVILAALPGMMAVLLVTENLVNPGNFRVTVNLLESQLRILGLDTAIRKMRPWGGEVW